jgi:hypothetical protein
MQVTGRKMTQVNNFQLFPKQFRLHFKSSDSPRLNRNEFLLSWRLVCKSYKCWLISYSNAKSHSHHSSLSSTTTPSQSRKFLFLASKLKDVSTLSHDSAIGLLYGKTRPQVKPQFQTKGLKLAMMSNEVRNFHNLFTFTTFFHKVTISGWYR